MLLLRARMNARIGRTGLPAPYVAQLWGAALAAAAAGWAVQLVLPPLHPILGAIAVLGPYGAVFLIVTWLAGIGEATTMLARITGRRDSSIVGREKK